jgi:hypothetical protein
MQPPNPQPSKSPAAVPFVVGHLRKKDSRIVFLNPPPPAPVRGPWELRAVFAA